MTESSAFVILFNMNKKYKYGGKKVGTKLFSIKYRIFIYVITLLVVLTLLLGILAIYQIEETQNNLAESEKMNLHMIISRLEDETYQIEKFLYNMVLNDNIIRSMASRQSETQLYAGTYDLQMNFDKQIDYNWDLNFLIIYSEENKYYYAKDEGLDALTVKEQIYLRRAVERRFIRYFLEKNARLGNWFAEEIGEHVFLCRITYNQGMYCSAAISLEMLVQSLEDYYNLSNVLMFRDGDRNLTKLNTEVQETLGEWTENRFGMVQLGETKRYMAVSEDIRGIILSYIIPYKGILYVLGWPTILLVIIAILSVTSLPVTYLYLKRNFFVPLDKLVDTMDSISTGNMEVTADDTFRSKEFRQVNRIFNQMINQIVKLKIERYERELEAKQANLQFLKAQIRPHFYLNCLKNLYSLASQRKYDNMKESILLLSNHLRYAFQQQGEMVPLKEEIRLCNNYIKLFEIQSDKAPKLILDIDNVAIDVSIPPVSLINFVENSIRYSFNPEQELNIWITASKLRTEDCDMLCLTVRDNGIGFGEEQLIQLNSPEGYESVKHHIGIQNVVRRFRLLYGDKFSIAFFNRNGAVIELYIPIDKL